MSTSPVVIHQVHSSIRRLLATGSQLRPKSMSTLRMDAEHSAALHRISMSIFADCTNVGVPFQEAIAAVYLSGLENGAALANPTSEPARG